MSRRKEDDQKVVLYNESQKRVIVQSDDDRKVSSPRTIHNICTLCKRPLDTVTSFIDHNYFRLLHTTHRSSVDLSSIRNIPHGAFNQGYYGRFFREGRRLGRGARGAVFLVQHYMEDEMLGEYALKKVPVGDDSGWLGKMLQEVHIMESLRHENIVSYKHTWLEIHKVSTFGPPVPCLFILMEYANAGNLEDYVTAEVIDVDNPKSSQQTQMLPINDVLSLFLGICKGLEHLHRFGIVHRDLKPSNILLNYPTDQVIRPNVLISDFGECNMVEENRKDRTGATGTIEFCAPELFKMSGRHYSIKHTTMTDVWSLGMILYYLLFGGSLPFENIDDVDRLRRDLLAMETVRIPWTRNDIPSRLTQLLKLLLDLEPEERPSAAETVSIVNDVILGLKGSKATTPKSIPLQLRGTVTPTLLRRNRTLLPWVVNASLGILLYATCYPRSISWKVMAIFLFAALRLDIWLLLLLQLLAFSAMIIFSGSACAC